MSNASAFAALAALAQTAKADMGKSASQTAKTAPMNVFAKPVAKPMIQNDDGPSMAGMLARMREQANPNSVEHALKRRFQDIADENGWTIA